MVRITITNSMKVYFSLLALIFSSNLFAQHRDTIFLKREVGGRSYPFYHAIFIDTTAQYRNELTSFSFNRFDSTQYFYQLKGLKPLINDGSSLRSKFPRKWIALHELKGRFYLYWPSDFGYHFRFEITDSTTIDFTMEGPEPSRLDKVSLLSPTHLIISRINFSQSESVDIKIIDTAKGIAIFTFSPTKYDKNGYQILMVDKAKAFQYPIIVNYCSTDKQQEYQFDEIDFKSLLK